MKKDKNLIWKFKWIFIKYLSIGSLFLGIIGTILFYIGKFSVKVLNNNASSIELFFTNLFNGFLHIISSLYFTIPLSLIVFYYMNKLWIKSLSDKDIKKLENDDIFWNEFKYFFNSFVLINSLSFLKIFWNNTSIDTITQTVYGGWYFLIPFFYICYIAVWVTISTPLGDDH